MNLARIFISHSSKDKAFAQIVVTALKQPNTEPWIDHENIIAGDDIFDRIGEALDTMDMFVLLISAHAINSGWIDTEEGVS
jgi:hypothetical protein